MTDRWELRDLTEAALLKFNTLAGTRVYSPNSTASWDGEMPVITLRSPYERKDSLGRVAAQFTTVATIVIVAQVAATTDAEAEQQLDILAKQIERAVINDYAIAQLIQQFLFVESKADIVSEGKEPFGQLTIAIGMEFYQGPEDFAPLDAEPLEQMTVTLDMQKPFDRTGIYKNPAFPSSVTPAPRTTGPDGRPEGGLIFNFPPEQE